MRSAFHPAVHFLLPRWLCFWLWMLPFAAWAQGWKAELLNGAASFRSDAPAELRFRITASAMATGRLEVRCFSGDAMAFKHRSQELVLQPGGQVVPLWVPMVPGGDNPRRFDLRFLPAGDGPAVALGSHRLELGTWGRQMVLACVNSGQPRESDQTLWRGLRFEALLDDDTSRDRSRQLSTRPAWLEVEDVPSTPLAYCAYDGVVVYPSAARFLRVAQWTALARWVDAGGHVLVVQTEPRTAAMDAFLKAVSREVPQVDFSKVPEGGMAFWCGMGRVVVVSQADVNRVGADSSVATTHLEQWNDWFWALKKSELAALNEQRKNAALERGSGGWRDSYDPWESEGMDVAAEVLSSSPKPFPYRTVAKLMLVFVLVVTVGDWFLLGWLKKRKMTWIVFPVLAAGGAVGMLLLAERHMGGQEKHGSLRLVDLGADGRILREVQWAMTFPSRSGMAEIKGAPVPSLYLPVPVGRAVQYGGTHPGFFESDGRAGAQFRMLFPQEQWIPNCLMSISFPDTVGVEGGLPGFQRWGDKDDSMFATAWSDLPETGSIILEGGNIPGERTTNRNSQWTRSKSPLVRRLVSHQMQLNRITNSTAPTVNFATRDHLLPAYPNDRTRHFFSISRRGEEITIYRHIRRPAVVEEFHFQDR